MKLSLFSSLAIPLEFARAIHNFSKIVPSAYPALLCSGGFPTGRGICLNSRSSSSEINHRSPTLCPSRPSEQNCRTRTGETPRACAAWPHVTRFRVAISIPLSITYRQEFCKVGGVQRSLACDPRSSRIPAPPKVREPGFEPGPGITRLGPQPSAVLTAKQAGGIMRCQTTGLPSGQGPGRQTDTTSAVRGLL